MKKIFFILFLLTPLFSYSQDKSKKDSTELSFPYQVGQQILLDLNDWDELKKLIEISKKEVNLLNNKTIEQEAVIGDLKKKVVICDSMIVIEQEKFKVIDDENKKLREDITKLKIKNTIFNIVGGAIVGGLTYIIVFK